MKVEYLISIVSTTSCNGNVGYVKRFRCDLPIHLKKFSIYTWLHHGRVAYLLGCPGSEISLRNMRHTTRRARVRSLSLPCTPALSRSPTLCASLSPLNLSLSLWLSWAFTPLSICSNLCARLTWVQLFVIVAASLCVCECVSVHEQSCQLFRLHCFSLAHCAAHYYTIYIVFFF